MLDPNGMQLDRFTKDRFEGDNTEAGLHVIGNYAYARALRALWDETEHAYDKRLVTVPPYDHAHSTGIVIKNKAGKILGTVGICGPIAHASLSVATRAVKNTPGLEDSITTAYI